MITIFCDGLTEPTNPGGYACCAFIAFEGETRTGTGAKVIHKQYACIGKPGDNMTNNIAEYRAVKAALRWAVKYDPDAEYVIKTDSQLVVRQVLGVWQCNAEHLKILRRECSETFSQLRNCSLVWIPREENTSADSLTRIAYQKARKAA